MDYGDDGKNFPEILGGYALVLYEVESMFEPGRSNTWQLEIRCQLKGLVLLEI